MLMGSGHARRRSSIWTAPSACWRRRPCPLRDDRRSIPLDELRYWWVERQEAYADAAASLEAERRAGTI